MTDDEKVQIRKALDRVAEILRGVDPLEDGRPLPPVAQAELAAVFAAAESQGLLPSEAEREAERANLLRPKEDPDVHTG